MTHNDARRRRKSGSGPSAQALIAWVGGPRAAGAAAGAGLSGMGAFPSSRVAGGRAILVGRACGLAAGTLLACGSVLVGAVHVGDGPVAGDAFGSGRLPGAADAAATPEGSGGSVPAGREVAAPAAVSAQAFAAPDAATRSRPTGVHRNSPASLDVPAEHSTPTPAAKRPWAPSGQDGQAAPGPVGPVSPVLDPAASGLARATPPVGGVLAPDAPQAKQSDPPVVDAAGTKTPLDEAAQPVAQVTQPVAQVTQPVAKVIQPVAKVIQPLEEATQPAMTMLGSSLPLG
ncbi:MAG TPA: hypothetical protein VIY28_13325 [Pseudonocardiaceae bacterium]